MNVKQWLNVSLSSFIYQALTRSAAFKTNIFSSRLEKEIDWPLFDINIGHLIFHWLRKKLSLSLGLNMFIYFDSLLIVLVARLYLRDHVSSHYLELWRPVLMHMLLPVLWIIKKKILYRRCYFFIFLLVIGYSWNPREIVPL